MSNLTIGIIKKINANCSNGFQLDIQDYQLLGNKNLSKTIKIDDQKLIKATLSFQDEFIKYMETGQRIPVLNVCVWTKSGESTMWSSGMGKFHYYKEKKVKRRNIAILQEITKEITDDIINKMAIDNRDESIFNNNEI